MKKLFAVYLWWKINDWFIEDHDIIFAVAKDKDEAKEIAKQKTIIKNDIHCDWIIEINKIDWYEIKLEKTWDWSNIIYDKTYQAI